MNKNDKKQYVWLIIYTVFAFVCVCVFIKCIINSTKMFHFLLHFFFSLIEHLYF